MTEQERTQGANGRHQALQSADLANHPMATLGILEWFRPGEEARVERVLAAMRTLDVKHLRTGFSWADWHTTSGERWYSWLMPRLAAEVDVLPCFSYTPPSLGVVAKSASPPREPKRYADFIDRVITDYGHCFDTVELWNEPNNSSEWDWTYDPHWNIFAEMIGGAAHWSQQRGKRTILGGMSPFDPTWLQIMCERGVMRYIDVVGIHGFPGVWEQHWPGWTQQVARVQQVLDEQGSPATIWLTETGFSTWQHNQDEQLRRFVDAAEAPVERVYWYAMEDLHSALPTVDGFHKDEREYHFGLLDQNAQPKLLYRLWADRGIQGVKALATETKPQKQTEQHTKQPQSRGAYLLITGGAGFVGTNLAHHYLSQGEQVMIYDTLARAGVEQNLAWLRANHGDKLHVEIADVRNIHRLEQAVRHATAVFHLAAQVAVTTSLVDPRHDFAVNAQGTMNLLEALRRHNAAIPLIFTSTNKVYGNLADVVLTEEALRYQPCDPTIAAHGISEQQALEFHSPYGASKGAADQYVLDYARTFGLAATVLRMSCIYGYHQFGTEDQGWVAHFLLSALTAQPITIYGDGKQVRDILFIDDLVRIFAKARTSITAMAGQAFNVGGGAANAISLRQLLTQIEQLHGTPPTIEYAPTRTGDQAYYVSDTRRLANTIGWQPSVSAQEGVERLYHWLREHRVDQSAPVSSLTPEQDDSLPAAQLLKEPLLT